MINEHSTLLFVHRGFSPRKRNLATENSRVCYRGTLPAAPANWGGRGHQALPEAQINLLFQSIFLPFYLKKEINFTNKTPNIF